MAITVRHDDPLKKLLEDAGEHKYIDRSYEVPFWTFFSIYEFLQVFWNYEEFAKTPSVLGVTFAFFREN